MGWGRATVIWGVAGAKLGCGVARWCVAQHVGGGAVAKLSCGVAKLGCSSWSVAELSWGAAKLSGVWHN